MLTRFLSILRRLLMPISLLYAIGLLTVAGCSHAPEQIGIDNAQKPVLETPSIVTRKVFIATTRKPGREPGVLFSDARASSLGLASVIVSIPPNHVPGKVERATNLPPDPEKEFAVVDPQIFETDALFVASINKELMKRNPTDRDILVFIHGYNNTLTDAVLRAAQFSNDAGFTGVPVVFSWASAGRLSRYVYDMNSALAARAYIEDASKLLAQTRASGFDLFAHSMGNLLLVDSLVQQHLKNNVNTTGKLENVILAAPDIDIDLFKMQLRQMGSNRGNIYVLVSKDDSALGVSRTLAGGIDRVGAADADELAELGVTVIDLSEVQDSSTGSHTKFAGSPEVVQLLGNGLKNGNYNSSPKPPRLVDTLNNVPIVRDIIPDF